MQIVLPAMLGQISVNDDEEAAVSGSSSGGAPIEAPFTLGAEPSVIPANNLSDLVPGSLPFSGKFGAQNGVIAAPEASKKAGATKAHLLTQAAVILPSNLGAASEISSSMGDGPVSPESIDLLRQSVDAISPVARRAIFEPQTLMRSGAGPESLDHSRPHVASLSGDHRTSIPVLSNPDPNVKTPVELPPAATRGPEIAEARRTLDSTLIASTERSSVGERLSTTSHKPAFVGPAPRPIDSDRPVQSGEAGAQDEPQMSIKRRAVSLDVAVQMHSKAAVSTRSDGSAVRMAADSRAQRQARHADSSVGRLPDRTTVQAAEVPHAEERKFGWDATTGGQRESRIAESAARNTSQSLRTDGVMLGDHLRSQLSGRAAAFSQSQGAPHQPPTRNDIRLEFEANGSTAARPTEKVPGKTARSSIETGEQRVSWEDSPHQGTQGQSHSRKLQKAQVKLTPNFGMSSSAFTPIAMPAEHGEALDGVVAFERGDAAGSRDARQGMPANPGSASAPLARAVGRQIVDSIRFPIDGTIEIKLSPEELGRVKLAMLPGEAGAMTVQMTVERAETLELLRRHADVLSTDLQDAGYSGLEFTFSREGEGNSSSHRTAETPEADDEKTVNDASRPIRTQQHDAMPSSGVDLRL